MVRRSVMFTPGDRPRMMRTAPESGADVIVFDLEDAVVPDRKADAREAVREVLADPEFDPDCDVCLRVNPIGFGVNDDLEGVLTGDVRLDGVMLPKVESADEVGALSSRLASYDVDVSILALVESARGVLEADAIAAVSETDALIFGAEDFVADVGAIRTRTGAETRYAHQRVVTAAAAFDVDAIDTVFTDLEDEDGLVEATERAIGLGYDGKLAIHPDQVATINEAFTPDPDDLEWARAVLEGEREADVEDRGVFAVDGEMIDAPLIAQAERILERAGAADVDDDAV
ncbi:HpcH/HpaI aldolase/citrate lyase family protein [Natrialbaceae archaeon AArc-T1-2]|uniref:HpcH/HpaI aldolase/citrate lyase family protein n=1 Tax=Natrialbaceae archaeon AArc-T1-2 TaxID=3053904 RepID=UPI00255AD48E|nr:CoA ester lyase [Natrialbaceae archaeon AArc-T1-2]WIV68093.1 CoA ester lyase [Natrialbaceae archaeon AArc-T1-2]